MRSKTQVEALHRIISFAYYCAPIPLGESIYTDSRCLSKGRRKLKIDRKEAHDKGDP